MSLPGSGTSWPYAAGEITPFTCPSCAPAVAPLSAEPEAALCQNCGVRYPIVGGVACLVPFPVQYQLEQLRRLSDYTAITAARQREIGVERREAPSSLTRERLLGLAHAMDVERKLVTEVLSPFAQGLDEAALRLVPRSAAPDRELSALEMYETVFRDWGWGEGENARALALVKRLLEPSGSLSGARLAVLGAGACRLAADVHRSFGPAATHALDINPLPLLIAERVLRGDTLEAFDYPVGPRGLARSAVRQRLRCQETVQEGLSLTLADARHPPFAPGSVDAVLTPWFIDVVGSELTETIATVHRTLARDGLWLNQGPLRFSGPASRRYSIEEVHELVRSGGFEIVTALEEDVAYFDSPYAGARRIETVYGFAARKVGESTVVVPRRAAAWATDSSAPIPLPPELPALQERLIFSAGALSLIDGERSLRDIAEALSGELEVEPERLIEPLRSLLATLLS